MQTLELDAQNMKLERPEMVHSEHPPRRWAEILASLEESTARLSALAHLSGRASEAFVTARQQAVDDAVRLAGSGVPPTRDQLAQLVQLARAGEQLLQQLHAERAAILAEWDRALRDTRRAASFAPPEPASEDELYF